MDGDEATRCAERNGIRARSFELLGPGVRRRELERFWLLECLRGEYEGVREVDFDSFSKL